MFEGYVTGIHPRSEELITARKGFRWKGPESAKGKADFNRWHETEARNFISLQRRLRFNRCSDGLFTWNSLIEPVSSLLPNVDIPATNIRRWFNTNTFYHKPIVKRKLGRAVKSFSPTVFRHGLMGKGWKAILPSPNTFARHVEAGSYRHWSDLLLDFAHAERKLLENLVRRGCTYVQLDDPSLVFDWHLDKVKLDDLEKIKQSIRVAVKGVNIRSCLQTYFEDAVPIVDQLLDFPVDDLGIDFTETSLDALKGVSFGKSLACAYIDSRNSRQESPLEIANFGRKAVEILGFKDSQTVYLCPNTGLRYLPRPLADEKLRNLSAAIKELKT